MSGISFQKVKGTADEASSPKVIREETVVVNGIGVITVRLTGEVKKDDNGNVQWSVAPGLKMGKAFFTSAHLDALANLSDVPGLMLLVSSTLSKLGWNGKFDEEIQQKARALSAPPKA